MKKLFALLGKIAALRGRGDPIRRGFSPYVDDTCNRYYNLAFCDKLQLIREDIGDQPAEIWTTLLAKEPYAAGLRAIADNNAEKSRLRLVACKRLREMQQASDSREILGVVIESGVQDGLDVLAAYADGSVLYLDHTEFYSAFDPVPTAWMSKVNHLLKVSRTVVERIGPWERPRIAPPTEGMIRLNFLVPDGLYFGQGLQNTMVGDDLAAPIISAGSDLIAAVLQQRNLVASTSQ